MCNLRPTSNEFLVTVKGDKVLSEPQLPFSHSLRSFHPNLFKGVSQANAIAVNVFIYFEL